MTSEHRNILSPGVMVARLTLNQLVKVRTLGGQLIVVLRLACRRVPLKHVVMGSIPYTTALVRGVWLAGRLL